MFANIGSDGATKILCETTVQMIIALVCDLTDTCCDMLLYCIMAHLIFLFTYTVSL